MQPNTDGYYIKTVQAIEEQFCSTKKADKPNRLFLLVNPVWREKSSFGIFGAQKAQELILDRYETTYAVDQFIVRWRQISLLKCWSSDWRLYAVVNDDSGRKDKQSMPAQLIASFASRPEYEEIDAVLKGVVKK